MEITNLSVNRTAELSKLKMKKFRDEKGMLVLEGKRLIGQLLSYGIKPLEILIRDAAQMPPGLDGIPVFRTDERGMKRICDTDHPQAIAGLFPVPKERKVDFRWAFYLDGISDPGNMGTIFRIAAAFGFDSILLSPDCVEISSPKVVRSSLGAVYSVPFRVLGLDDLTKLDCEIYATSASEGEYLHELKIDAEDRGVVIIGSEAHGVRPEAHKAANRSLRVDMLPGMESLNAAVAAGIIAHQIYHSGTGTDSV